MQLVMLSHHVSSEFTHTVLLYMCVYQKIYIYMYISVCTYIYICRKRESPFGIFFVFAPCFHRFLRFSNTQVLLMRWGKRGSLRTHPDNSSSGFDSKKMIQIKIIINYHSLEPIFSAILGLKNPPKEGPNSNQNRCHLGELRGLFIGLSPGTQDAIVTTRICLYF